MIEVADGLDAITGLIGPVVAAGAVMKITDSMFGGTRPQPRPQVRPQARRAAPKRTASGKSSYNDEMHRRVFGY